MLRLGILRLGILPAILAAMLVSALAQAQPQANPSGGIRIQVGGHREVQGTKPPASANVKNLDTGKDQTVEIGANGRADVTGLSDGVYVVTVAPGDRMGSTYVQVKDGKLSDAQFSAQGLPLGSTFGGGPNALLAAARQAAETCNRAAYDAAVTELDRDLALAEINLRDINRIVDEYGRLTSLQPDLEQLQKTRDTILRGAMGGRVPGASGVRTNAVSDQGLRFLPQYIAALREKQRLEARLNAVRAARAAVPPFPAEKCSRDAEKLFQQAALQFLVAPELTVMFANRPQFLAFRLELAGVITKLGAFKPDNTDTGTKIGMGVGMRWDSSLLGTKQIGIEAKVSYVDYRMTDSGDVVADPGGTIGLFGPATTGNPFGGYFTAGPLTNGRYKADVKSFGGEIQVQTWLGSGNFRAMPWMGMRVGRTTVKEDMRFDVGAPAFTTFEQHNDIKDTSVGPTIGLKARLDFGGGLYGFGEGSLGLEYHRGKGDLSTFVPAAEMEPRKDRLSSSKWGFSAGIKAGLGFEVGRFGLQFGVGMSYTNASPYLQYKEADSTTTGTGGADIGYGRQTDYFGEVRGTIKF